MSVIINNKQVKTEKKGGKTYCSIIDFVNALPNGQHGQTNFSNKGYRFSASANTDDCSLIVVVNPNVNTRLTILRAKKELSQGFKQLQTYDPRYYYWVQRKDSNWKGVPFSAFDYMVELNELCAKTRECGFELEITAESYIERYPVKYIDFLKDYEAHKKENGRFVLDNGGQTIGFGHDLSEAEKQSGIYDDGLSVEDALELAIKDLNKAYNERVVVRLNSLNNDYGYKRLFSIY